MEAAGRHQRQRPSALAGGVAARAAATGASHREPSIQKPLAAVPTSPHCFLGASFPFRFRTSASTIQSLFLLHSSSFLGSERFLHTPPGASPLRPASATSRCPGLDLRALWSSPRGGLFCLGLASSACCGTFVAQELFSLVISLLWSHVLKADAVFRRRDPGREGAQTTCAEQGRGHRLALLH